jgi:DNA-binding CsgD family transcriptional regulator
MLPKKIKKLVAARAKLASLEQAIANEMNKELAGLPSKYGFGDVAQFLAAVKAAAGKKRGRPRRAAKAAPATGRKRRRRAVITDATRGELKKLVEAGKTGAEIAKALKISLPSVQNIKKALGLVKKR